MPARAGSMRAAVMRRPEYACQTLPSATVRIGSTCARQLLLEPAGVLVDRLRRSRADPGPLGGQRSGCCQARSPAGRSRHRRWSVAHPQPDDGRARRATSGRRSGARCRRALTPRAVGASGFAGVDRRRRSGRPRGARRCCAALVGSSSKSSERVDARSGGGGTGSGRRSRGRSRGLIDFVASKICQP